MNPADMLSRGVSASQLANKKFWWSGPEFLEKEETEWPEQKRSWYNNDKESEKEKVKKISTLLAVNTEQSSRLEPIRYSSWQRLTRVNAWIYRFLHNCSSQKKVRTTGELSSDEIEDAEIRILTQVQKDEFCDEYAALSKGEKVLSPNSKLLSLQPIIDDQGLMRVNGRLRHAECLSFGARFPIILPRHNWVTKLIVKHYHEVGNHVMGTNQTLSAILSKFWIISGREEIRQWERECAKCKRDKAKPAYQVMAPLPKFRVQPSLRAFTDAGVDFAGPFLTVQGRNKKRRKRYLCLFTCLKTRALHLEVAYGLDTNSFLNAFYRMASRRGLPEVMVSDNGTNFVGAIKELKELVQQMDQDVVMRSLANKGVKCFFNPPHTPHFGGIFETMIKAAKRAIYAILSKGDITDEDLITAMAGAEGLINSRPLTYQSAHPQDDTPLTPNHFLHGQAGGVFAPECVDTTDFNPRRRWRRIQELVRHFWKRWMREWLPSLNTRKKWNRQARDLQEKDVVLVISQKHA